VKVAILHTQDAIEPPEDPVLSDLEGALSTNNHEFARVVVNDKIEPVIEALKKLEPDIVFNMAEAFAGRSALESNVAALLNLLGQRYTGSSPAGLILAGDKTLTKKVLTFHGILTARFATVFRGAVDWAGDINFPLILKPPQEDASLGITQKSIVNDVQELLKTMSSLQTEYQSPVLAEEFIDGREIYVGVYGNEQLTVLPPWELTMRKRGNGGALIATDKVKWDPAHQKKVGLKTGAARLEAAHAKSLELLSKRIYRLLGLSGYARLDYRLNAFGTFYLLEANPNPQIARDEDFAQSAMHARMSYDDLLQKLITLGQSYAAKR